MSWITGGIGAGISTAGSLIGMYGSYRASKEQEVMAKYNAQVARNRGKAQQKAIQVQNDIERDVDRAELSKLENQMANSGAKAGVGSPLLVATATFADQQADRNEMNRQANIARQQGEQEALMYEYQAESLKSSRGISLLSQAIGGAAGAGSAYQSWG